MAGITTDKVQKLLNVHNSIDTLTSSSKAKLIFTPISSLLFNKKDQTQDFTVRFVSNQTQCACYDTNHSGGVSLATQNTIC